VLQHGVTKLDGVKPEIRISNGDAHASFPALPTGRPGEYHADVVFPREGTWRWEIWDGFSGTHTYAPVLVGEPASGSPWRWLVVAGVAGLFALGGSASLVLRFRRRQGIGTGPAAA
jgi:hypothetical protein